MNTITFNQNIPSQDYVLEHTIPSRGLSYIHLSNIVFSEGVELVNNLVFFIDDEPLTQLLQKNELQFTLMHPNQLNFHLYYPISATHFTIKLNCTQPQARFLVSLNYKLISDSIMH